MPGTNPLINSGSVFASTPPQSAGESQAGVYPAVKLTGVQAPLTGEHNTAAHVGLIVVGALLVIVALHAGGFRFVVDAGLVRGAR